MPIRLDWWRFVNTVRLYTIGQGTLAGAGLACFALLHPPGHTAADVLGAGWTAIHLAGAVALLLLAGLLVGVRAVSGPWTGVGQLSTLLMLGGLALVDAQLLASAVDHPHLARHDPEALKLLVSNDGADLFRAAGNILLGVGVTAMALDSEDSLGHPATWLLVVGSAGFAVGHVFGDTAGTIGTLILAAGATFAGLRAASSRKPEPLAPPPDATASDFRG